MKHEVVAWKSLWCGIIFCTMGLWLLEFSTEFAAKHGSAECGEWGGREGKKILGKTVEKRERRAEWLERRERCDQGRKQGKKNTAPRRRE